MKKKFKIIMLSIFVLAILSLPLFLVQKQNVKSVHASTGEDYINFYNSDKAEIEQYSIDNSQNGGVTFEKKGFGAPWLSITFATDVQNTQIKRIVANKVISLSSDDVGNPLSSTSLTYIQDGTYVVLYERQGQKLASYYAFECEFEITTNDLIIDNGNYLTNDHLVYGNGNTITISFNEEYSPYDFCFKGLNSELTSFSFATNSTQTIQIKKESTILYEAQIDIIAEYPSVSFKNDNGEEILDVISQYFGNEVPMSLIDTTKIFNQAVSPFMKFTGFSNDEKALFESHFQLHQESHLARIEAIADNNIKYNETIFVINTKLPSEYMELHLQSSTGSLYEDTQWKDTLYAFSHMYPISINSNFELVMYVDKNHEESNSLISNENTIANVLIIGKHKTTNEIIFAFNFEWHYFEQNNLVNLQLENDFGSGNVTIRKQNSDIKVPIDVQIIASSSTYEIYSFLSEEENEKDITFLVPGTYKIIAKYRGFAFNGNDHKPTNNFITITSGNSIASVTTQSGVSVVDGQIVSEPVSIAFNGDASYSIMRNSKPYSGTYMSETGFYEIEAELGNLTTTISFTIVSSSSPLFTYTIPQNANISDIIVTNQNGQTYNFQSNDYTISYSGSYTISYKIKSTLTVKVGESEYIEIVTTNERSYNIVIAPANISVVASVKNGESSSKAIKVSSISAGNNSFRVIVDKNGNKTTYTGEQYNNLSEKDRTYSKTGVYKITVIDQNGNQLQYSFQKYYKMNTGLIILIAVVGAAAVVGLFLLLRLRMKTRVR